MDALSEAIETVEQQRKTLEVHTADKTTASDLKAQFSTRNVQVTHEPLAAADESGFVIIRGADGEYRGAIGIDDFRALLSPEIHPPWALAEQDTIPDDLFDFLDNTIFTAYNRRQMLATAREIEERAWRVADGTLYTGFQNQTALNQQLDVYERLADRGSLTVRLFVDDSWESDIEIDADVVSESAAEIGEFWFVIFEGAGSVMEKCGLIAEERAPGSYYGFWTYDSVFVVEITQYLEEEYG